MAAIQYTDRGTAVRLSPNSRALTQAVLAALDAPSILNTQPWHWRIDDDTAELRADRGRQLSTIDPDGRLLTLSCGVALHHARIALACDGADAEVRLLPEDGDPDLLATVRIIGAVERIPQMQRLRRAMALRRTDRRPFADLPVPEDSIERLVEVAGATGVHLHLTRPQDLVDVTVAAGHAADVEQHDPGYRAELAAWVHVEDANGDGVPPATAAAAGPRPVPVRDFTGTGAEQLSVYAGIDLADRNARYAVLVTDGDLPRDWLIAGEALSAVLLTATAEGLAVSPMSDLVEVLQARLLLQRMLGGIGHPAIVVRIGVPGQTDAAPKAPRRPSAAVVDLVARHPQTD